MLGEVASWRLVLLLSPLLSSVFVFFFKLQNHANGYIPSFGSKSRQQLQENSSQFINSLLFFFFYTAEGLMFTFEMIPPRSHKPDSPLRNAQHRKVKTL